MPSFPPYRLAIPSSWEMSTPHNISAASKRKKNQFGAKTKLYFLLQFLFPYAPYGERCAWLCLHYLLLGEESTLPTNVCLFVSAHVQNADKIQYFYVSSRRLNTFIFTLTNDICWYNYIKHSIWLTRWKKFPVETTFRNALRKLVQKTKPRLWF